MAFVFRPTIRNTDRVQNIAPQAPPEQESPFKLSDFVPGAQLAKGLGTAIATIGLRKQQERIFKRDLEIQNELIKKLKEARSQGDRLRVDRLKKVLSDMGSHNVIEAAIEDAPTTRQIIASSVELAAFAAMGLKPGTRAKSFVLGGKTIRAERAIRAAQTAQKLRSAGKAKVAISKVGIPVAREAVIGGGLFGLSEAAINKDATANDIIRAGEQGALFGAGSFGLLAGMGFAAKKAFQAAREPVKRATSRIVSQLERTATRTKIKPKTQIQKTLSLINENIGTIENSKRKAAQVAVGALTGARKIKTRLVDRFSPLFRIEDEIRRLTGRSLKDSEKIGRDARLLQSVSDASAETKVKKLTNSLKPYDDVIPESKAYLSQLDFIDRAKLGQKVPGGQSLKELKDGLRKMIVEIGPENMKKMAQVRKVVNEFNFSLLNDRVNAGLITQETMDTLIRTHPNYMPHNVIMDIDERFVKGLSQSLNVPKTDIFKAVGSVRKIEDPLAATIQRTQIATRTIEKNKLLNNLVNTQEKLNVIPGMKRLRPGEKPANNFNSINLFKNGNKETWQVPGDLAVALKGLDTPATPTWFRLATSPQRLLKRLATKFNLSFAIPNLFRDKQTAAITARSFIEEIGQKYGTTDALKGLSRKEIRELYKTSGGYGASIFEEGEDQILKQLEKAGVVTNLKKANPAKIIDTVNTEIEMSTRVNVFKKALASGLSPKDAAFVARDATIDFAKMGTWMKNLNQVIPFLNARVQGFVNLPRAIAGSPQAFARMQMYTAVYPTLGLYQHNRRFDSYKNISQYYKNKYWVIMTGEEEAIDEFTGKNILVPQFVTIPKGEGQALVSGPIQAYLEKSDGIDFRTTSEIIADTIGSASPLEFQAFDSGNIWLTLAAQLGPAVSIATGLASGKDPFFGTDIVPAKKKEASTELQFKSTTPEATKELANIIGVAPAKLEFVLNSFGGVPQDVQRAIDLVYGVVREGRLGGNSITETPFGTATQIPLARRFVREAPEAFSPEQTFRKGQKQEIEKVQLDARLKLEEQAEKVWRELNKRKTKEDKLNYLNSLGDELTEPIKEKIMAWKTSRRSVEVLKKTDSIETRAVYINNRLEEMKKNGVPREELVRYLNELEAAKILTQRVKERIFKLKAQ